GILRLSPQTPRRPRLATTPCGVSATERDEFRSRREGGDEIVGVALILLRNRCSSSPLMGEPEAGRFNVPIGARHPEVERQRPSKGEGGSWMTSALRPLTNKI